jgi:hypothetical protein
LWTGGTAARRGRPGPHSAEHGCPDRRPDEVRERIGGYASLRPGSVRAQRSVRLSVCGATRKVSIVISRSPGDRAGREPSVDRSAPEIDRATPLSALLICGIDRIPRPAGRGPRPRCPPPTSTGSLRCHAVRAASCPAWREPSSSAPSVHTSPREWTFSCLIPIRSRGRSGTAPAPHGSCPASRPGGQVDAVPAPRAGDGPRRPSGSAAADDGARHGPRRLAACDGRSRARERTPGPGASSWSRQKKPSFFGE